MKPKELSRREFLTAALLCTPLAVAAAEETRRPDELVVAFIPLANPERILPSAGRIADHLAKSLGLPVRVFVPTDYAGVVEAMRRGRAHVAFLGLLATALAYQEAGAIPILGEIVRGEFGYSSLFLVPKDSPVRSLGDLRGKKVAFSDPTSGSGFLFPLTLLVKEGSLERGKAVDQVQGFFKQVLFSGGDEFTIRALVRGQVDAAALADYSFRRYATEEERDRYRVLAATRLPPHSVAVHPGLPPDLTGRLREALLALNAPQNRDLLRSLYGAEGFAPATLETYRPVFEAAELTGFPLRKLLK
jgi:phosphonate transport system substrate-binding protein